MNGKWITMAHPECAIWKKEKHTRAREQAYQSEIDAMHGSYIFRKRFPVKSNPLNATLRVCGLGFYETEINGEKPDVTKVLTPVLSDYYRLCRYDTYDITRLLVDGENTVKVEVCDGWFSPEPKYWGWQNTWHGDPRLIASLTITYRDGNEETVSTDETWQWAGGMVLHSSIYDGETVDFNRVPTETDWHFAVLAEAPTDNLVSSAVPPIRICRTLTPVKTTQLSDTQFLFDFGENGAKIPCVTVHGKKGDTVILRHAEFLHEDGTPDFASQNRAESTDTFTLNEDICRCRPRFTWHGYRYLLLTVSAPSVTLLSAESYVIHSDLAETGYFACDNEQLNHLHDVCIRTELACLLGVPVDCPQRDERKAWMGDAHVTSELCFYNFDMRGFYRSLLEDIRLDCEANGNAPFICPGDYNRTTDADGITTSLDWNIAYPILLSEYTMRYKDIPLLAKHLSALKKHIAYYTSQCRDGLLPDGWFGDWFSLDFPDGTEKVAFVAGNEEHRQNPIFASTMFFCKTLRLVKEIALLCGDTAYAKEAEALWNTSRDALYRRYYHKDTGKFGSGGQFLSAFALAEHLVYPEDEQTVFSELLVSLSQTDYHPIVGVVGMRILFDVLSSYGRPDIAYRVLTAEGFPGLLDMISHDRTTLTEGQDGSGSGCHCMFASPDAQLYRLLGGICIDRTATVPIQINPYCPDTLHHVSCGQILPEGTLSVSWERENGELKFHIEIPENMEAKISLPDGYTEILHSGEFFFCGKEQIHV